MRPQKEKDKLPKWVKGRKSHKGPHKLGRPTWHGDRAGVQFRSCVYPSCGYGRTILSEEANKVRFPRRKKK